MLDHLPILITAWSKDYQRLGVVGGIRSAEAYFRKNLPGSGMFELDADAPRVPDLAESGARVVMEYRYAPGVAPVAISGGVEELTGDGPTEAATRIYQVTDDFADVFNDVLGWPNPTGTDTEQGDDGAYFKRTGPAETVLKQILVPNAQRAGINLTVPATLGRGQTITVSIRMHPLYDRLFPAVDQAGLRVRVLQQDDQRVLLVDEPTVHTRELTQASGIVVKGSFQIKKPTITRGVVMAGGEGTARIMRKFVDAAREAEWGTVRERAIDARDIDPAAPDLEAQIVARANEALAEGAGKTGLKVETTETDQWRFGKTFMVGDRVTVRLDGAPPLPDYVREVGVVWDAETGDVQVTPLIGAWEDSPSTALKNKVAAIDKNVRDMQRR